MEDILTSLSSDDCSFEEDRILSKEEQLLQELIKKPLVNFSKEVKKHVYHVVKKKLKKNTILDKYYVKHVLSKLGDDYFYYNSALDILKYLLDDVKLIQKLHKAPEILLNEIWLKSDEDGVDFYLIRDLLNGNKNLIRIFLEPGSFRGINDSRAYIEILPSIKVHEWFLKYSAFMPCVKKIKLVISCFMKNVYCQILKYTSSSSYGKNKILPIIREIQCANTCKYYLSINILLYQFFNQHFGQIYTLCPYVVHRIMNYIDIPKKQRYMTNVNISDPIRIRYIKSVRDTYQKVLDNRQ